MLIVAIVAVWGASIAVSDEITVTTLDGASVDNNSDTLRIDSPYSYFPKCNVEKVTKYFNRKPLNNQHLKIMCNIWKSDMTPMPVTAKQYVSPAAVSPGVGMHKDTRITWGSPVNKTIIRSEYNTTEYWHYDNKNMITICDNYICSIMEYQ